MADAPASVASTRLPGDRRGVGRALVYAALAALAALYLMPLVVMALTSVKDLDEIRTGDIFDLPRAWTFGAWREAWATACIGVSCDGLRGFFGNSVRMVVPAVALSTLLGALNGFALTKFRFRGSQLVFALMLFGCFVPFQAVILPMARFLGAVGLASSTGGLVLVHVVYGLAFTTLFFRNYYMAVPDDLIRAATMDGAGFFTIFRRIILPLSPPIIIVTVIWQFTGIWNDFLFGAVFTAGVSQPVTVALNNLASTSTGVKQYNVDMAAALLAALPTLTVYVLAGRYFVRGLMAGAVKG